MTVRVAGGQGFYGDTPRSVEGLLADGVDYLCLEALAELTLAILQKDRQKDEARGFTRDLPVYLAAALPEVAAGRTRVITNAGGINPAAAARAAAQTARDLGISGIRIATVLGDDLTGRVDDLARRDRAPAPRHRCAVHGAAVSRGARVGVPGCAPDRRRARAGRRCRHHRSLRRCRALPRAARARARVGVGRLGPACGRGARGSPPRVLGSDGRGQPESRLVDRPAPLGSPLPDRRRRRRRHRGHHQAARLRRTRELRHRQAPAPVRGPRPVAVPRARCGRRLHERNLRRPR